MLLNPRFSAYVQGLVPAIIEEATVFRQALFRRAQAGEMFYLIAMHKALRLTGSEESQCKHTTGPSACLVH
jgi:hypothetical protein